MSIQLIHSIREQITAARAQTGPARIALPPGRHLITPERLPERFCHISNNDDGLKRILFDLEGLTDVEVDGGGAELIMRGRGTIPFYLQDSRNLTVRNLSIDLERSTVSEAEVLAVDENGLRIRFREDQPVRVVGGTLIFHGEGYISDDLHQILEFVPERRETAYKVKDTSAYECQKLVATDLGDGTIHLAGCLRSTPTVGNILSFKHDRRYNPAIVIDHCQNVRLEDINLYSAGGMGVIAQCSRDTYLHRLTVCPRPGSGRMISLHADATHFVDCLGDIHLTECNLHNQLDDAINIHGIFWRVNNRQSDTTFEIQQVHFQQLGIDTIRTGDTVGFYCRETFRALGEATVASITRLNSHVADLQIASPLPPHDGDMMVMPVNHDVNVLISHCSMGNNRARGMLVSTLGKIRIEHTTFHSPGTAIRICGEAKGYCESGPVEDVEIYHNTFDNCNYGVWGDALLVIRPQIQPDQMHVPFHRNIRIHHNTIRRFHRPLIQAGCVDGLRFHDNTLIDSTAYPPSATGQEAFIFEGAVTNAEIDQGGG